MALNSAKEATLLATMSSVFLLLPSLRAQSLYPAVRRLISVGDSGDVFVKSSTPSLQAAIFGVKWARFLRV